MARNDGGSRKKQKNMDYSSTINILIGPNEKSLTVHIANITAVSDFFKTACDSQWKEGEEGIVRLPEADENTFPAYVHWAYTSQLCLSDIYQSAPEDETKYLFLAKLWVLGDMLLDRHWCNGIMDAVLYHIEDDGRTTRPEVIQYVCDHTAAYSELRKVFLEHCAHVANAKSEFQRWADHWPHSFAMSVAEGVITSISGRPTIERACEYHIHEQEDECDESDWDEIKVVLGEAF